MRSAADLRQRWLETVPAVVARAGMYARDGREMETVARILLEDLCFLDERDNELERIRTVLANRFGKLGVHGPFAAMFGRENSCTAEVTSVYAEHFHRLGYLKVDRQLDHAEWETLVSGLRDRFEDHDVRRSEVEAAFGPPSLIVDKRILCYVSATSGGWVFFDCWDEPQRHYVSGMGRYQVISDADQLIRSIRIPADDFESGLILTLYGKVLRWGPGWWIHHPSGNTSEESQAIAAQLRDIEARDPSQSLVPSPSPSAPARTEASTPLVTHRRPAAP